MLMIGKEYLQSIRDGRVIYVGKERVKDQTTHPAFASGARTYAALFDMKADPALRDVMTFEESGQRYSMYYLQPRSQEDLRRRDLRTRAAQRPVRDLCNRAAAGCARSRPCGSPRRTTKASRFNGMKML